MDRKAEKPTVWAYLSFLKDKYALFNSGGDKMKKKVVFLLCTVLAISSCFIGCGNKTTSEPKTNDAQKEVSANKE